MMARLADRSFTVLLIPDETGDISALVPAMPGCVSFGQNRKEVLDRIREAMAGWLEVEAEHGRQPLDESPDLILESVAQSLHTLDEMRLAGELSKTPGYALELMTVRLRQPETRAA